MNSILLRALTDGRWMELSALQALIPLERQTTVFRPSEMELNKVTELLLSKIREAQPRRIVFDSLSEFRLMAETSLRYRRELLQLKREFAAARSTVLLLDDKMDKAGVRADPHIMSLAHGVIELEQLSPDYGTSRRRLRVMKMRGVKFREGYHDYVIMTGGLRVFPRLIAAEHHIEFQREPVSSGIKELDLLVGGGLDRGTTTLMMGSAGSGKSTLALQYLIQFAERGEKGVIFAFDENAAIMRARADGLGMPLRQHIESGLITVRQLEPAEVSPGEFVALVRDAVQNECKVVVIDSLNGYLNAMPGEKYLNNQLHELLAYLDQQGIVTILILAQHGFVTMLDAPVDLSYLCDTVISMRHFEAAGEMKLSVAVMKNRTGCHEKTIREFRLEPNRGLRIGEPLKDFQGVLSGVPQYLGRKEQMLKPA
jgi:circadian clock protein KaiC